MKDIQTKEDIRCFVDSFYDKVNADAILSPVFNHHSKVNWEKHLPIMYDFWASIILGSMEYKGQPFPKHAGLPVEKKHFEQWVHLFTQTIDDLFSGPVADMVKIRAVTIASAFRYKMGIY
ncbi:MAG: group III truncated hemoglobin [Cytophagaceae bacterium]